MTLCPRFRSILPVYADADVRVVPAATSPSAAPAEADGEAESVRNWNRVTGAAVIFVVYTAAVLVTHFVYVSV